MKKLELKKHNMILIVKQLRYQHYYQAILINVKFLKLKKYYLLVQFKRLNKLILFILVLKKHLKNKQKQLKIKKCFKKRF